MSAEPSPNRLRQRLVRFAPRSLQARLTIAFVGVTALVLVIVSTVVLNRLDDYFKEQVRSDLGVRAALVRDFADVFVRSAANGGPVVGLDGSLNPNVASSLNNESTLAILARVAQADLTIRIGSARVDVSGGTTISPSPGGEFTGKLAVESQLSPNQTRDGGISFTDVYPLTSGFPYAMEVDLADPYTNRAATLRTATTLLLAFGGVALLVAIVVASVIARRFTRPLVRLTEASRALAEGDLTQRVPAERAIATSSEIAELARQFNAMADRLQESVEIIRRDRDRSRDFLADVSHELRTPIAALRTFTELLQGAAGADQDARREFLESSAQQLERLDWLAQNLLELSKLDSGLVLLDLRPEDLRAAVESAVEQAYAGARRRGVHLTVHLPDAPLRIRHDPQRIGQVVSNLVGNALKFTPRGGRVEVRLEPHPDGAVIEVTDTGVGIDATELPLIFDRFYRGAQASEARSSGSGLGLAIVKSIVDMHAGRVVVESRVGLGSTFRVVLPRDPRLGEDALSNEPEARDAVNAADPDASGLPVGIAATVGQGEVAVAHQVDITNSSPSEATSLNPGPSA